MAPDEASVVNDLVLRGNEKNLASFPADVSARYRIEILRLAGRTSPSVEVYVAELEKRVVGTITLLLDGMADAHPWPAGAAVLRFLAVEDAARGRHCGRLLTSFCIDAARRAGSSTLGLHTAPSMTSARRLYEGLGFVRSPLHDFDPVAHYAHREASGPAWGLAYLLPLRSVA